MQYVRLLRLVILALWCALVIAASGQQPHESAAELFRESYVLAKDFVPSERAYHLFRLADFASQAGELESSRLWAEELFGLTLKLSPSWNRVALQKNAAVVLSRANPEGAFRLLSEIEQAPQPTGERLPEDLRASAARFIFSAYWKKSGRSGISAMRSEAIRIGETGCYPFGAVAPIIRQLSADGVNTARSWIEEAIPYYRGTSKVANADAEFFEFLNALWDVLPKDLRHQTLHMLVERLDVHAQPEEGASYVAAVHKGQTAALFNSPSQRMLFELLPKVREIDAAWESELRERSPELKQTLIPGEPEYREEVKVGNVRKVEPAQSASSEQRALERGRLGYVQDLSKTDPGGAIRVANGLTDPGTQAEAFAMIAASLAAKDPHRAKDLVRRAMADFGRLTDRSDELGELASIVDAALLLGDLHIANSMLSRGFDLGEELFEEFAQTHPATPAYEAPFLEDFGRLIRLSTKVEPITMLRRINGLGNRPLRAYLLLYAAKGLNDISAK